MDEALYIAFIRNSLQNSIIIIGIIIIKNSIAFIKVGNHRIILYTNVYSGLCGAGIIGFLVDPFFCNYNVTVFLVLDNKFTCGVFCKSVYSDA